MAANIAVFFKTWTKY